MSLAAQPRRSSGVSVLTPTWNRAHLLPRVFAGLMAQSDRCFEWIVADDGSTDGSGAVIADLAREAPFPVVYLRADARVGKARMDNEAVRQAHGELTIWCDSDDHFLPDTIATLRATWSSIPAEARAEYVGVTALAATNEGVIVDPLPGVQEADVTWNDLTERRHVNADMVYMIRTDALRAHPFPEVDFVVPESVVWSQLGERRARYIAKVVKMVEYRTANAISFSGDMAYNRGRAYALALTGRSLRRYPKPRRTRWWRLVTFIRYGILADMSASRMKSLWGDNTDASLFWAAYPLAAALAARDVLRGCVVRSHREFDRHRHVVVNVQQLN